jgi:hypothetical protein
MSQRAPASRRFGVWVAGLSTTAVLAPLLLDAIGPRLDARPRRHDESTTRVSTAGLYRLSYAPIGGAIPVNRIHSWALHVEGAVDQRPVAGAKISVDGAMPEHRHGLAARPEVSPAQVAGEYTVEGMKFQMYGWWVVSFEVEAPLGADRVAFDLRLRP